MEFMPIKINWVDYQRELANGVAVPKSSRLSFRCNLPEDTGSVNSALSDFFPLLQPNLPDEVVNAVGPLIGAIAVCGIKGWPWPDDAPAELKDAGHQGNSDIGLLYSPTTVSRIVVSFQSVPLDTIQRSLSLAWTKISSDSSKYRYSSPNHFTDSDDFLRYLLGWYETFAEASTDGHGVGIHFE